MIFVFRKGPISTKSICLVQTWREAVRLIFFPSERRAAGGTEYKPVTLQEASRLDFHKLAYILPVPHLYFRNEKSTSDMAHIYRTATGERVNPAV